MNSKSSNKMNVERLLKSNLFRLLLAIVCFFSLGFMFGRLSNQGNIISIGGKIDKNMDQFWQVWNTLQEQYVDEKKTKNEKDLMYGSIKGLVDSIGDPATVYLTPSETEEFNKSIEGKSFQGIGAELNYDNGYIVVVAPLKGSPAEKAGIKSGDRIVKVDSKEIKSNESIFDVVSKIRGEAGTKVSLTVVRKGEIKPLDISITRGEIDVPSMELKDVDNLSGVKILRVSRFTDESVSAWNGNWDKMVREIVATKAKGLILDLRGNPGGFFDSALHAGSDFLKKGEIMAKQENRNGKEEVFRVERAGKLLDIPLVVLVDEGSASASEILSGMLQQNGRAKIVGVNTYGKGTAQTIVNYKDGSSLHITILKWLLPKGEWLNRENPIKPDEYVEYPETDYKKGNDVQLNKAIELIKSKI